MIVTKNTIAITKKPSRKAMVDACDSIVDDKNAKDAGKFHNKTKVLREHSILYINQQLNGCRAHHLGLVELMRIVVGSIG